MGIRGRKGRAALTVVGDGEIPRPPPDNQLTDEEAEEWREIVNRMPADWFPRETHCLLVQLCRHIVAARRIAQLIEAAIRDPELDVKLLDKLYKMQERESRAIASLATKLRISQQSTYDKSRKKGTVVKRPWD